MEQRTNRDERWEPLMQIVLFGIEELGESCLKALLGSGYDVRGLVTLPPAASKAKPGRLRKWLGTPPCTPIEGIAKAHRIPILTPARLREPEFLRAFARLKPDLVIVACFDKILPPELLELPRLGGINVHPSLLPRHRGPAPVGRTLLAGDSETGISVHVMDAGIDTGELLVQHRHLVLPDDCAGSLSHRLAVAAPIALLETLKKLWEGSLQPSLQQGQVTQAPFITRQEAHLDWRAPVAQLLRTIRACCPHPSAFTLLGNEPVAILDALEIPQSQIDEAPGTILAVGPQGVVIQAGDGALACRKLRLGGRVLSPERVALLFAVGETVVSGDWSASSLT